VQRVRAEQVVALLLGRARLALGARRAHFERRVLVAQDLRTRKRVADVVRSAA
jgi:hypothetical protein